MTDVDWSQPAYGAVVRLLGERTGLAFAASRRDDAEAGIRRAMSRANVTDPERYLALLRAGDLALDDLVVEVTVGETYFFRETSHFDFIQSEVLPDVARRRGPEHVLRAWSAGCASGEEAYSLAILLDEVGLGGRAHILGTDISRVALAKARAAAYGPWSLRGVEETLVRRHFRLAGQVRELDEQIRQRVVFEHLNLALDAYPSLAAGVWGMDLILCRNVLIYFDREAIRRVARRMLETLADGGWLLTGPSDPPLCDDAPFEAVSTPAGLFYRRGHGAARVFLSTHETLASSNAPANVPAPAEALPLAVDATPFQETAARADALAEARAALAAGDYGSALRLTEDLAASADAALTNVRATANHQGSDAAASVAQAALRHHPLSAELHLVRSLLLLDIGSDAEAAAAVKRALYLDPTLAVAHFTLGSAKRRLRDPEGARRAYRNAHDLCAGGPPEGLVPLGDGERFGRLAAAANAQLALLDESRDGMS